LSGGVVRDPSAGRTDECAATGRSVGALDDERTDTERLQVVAARGRRTATCHLLRERGSIVKEIVATAAATSVAVR
jgi:hypothetical protein